jgi:metal-responsive CopG/Arc/MetJ family transcriptional regulator
MKVNVSLDDDLMRRIDECADANYMTRSGFITLACTQYLNAADVTRAISDMALAMRKIADKGMVDNETLEQLQDFERIAKMLSGA